MKEIREFVNPDTGVKIEFRLIEGRESWRGDGVAELCGYAKASDMYRMIPDDERTNLHLMRCGKSGKSVPHKTGFLYEPGVYRAIFHSKRPEAEAIRKWWFNEVMPSIRRHGGYLTPEKAQEVLDKPEAILAMAEEIVRQSGRIKLLERREAKFGNRTPFGQISDSTGMPRTLPVRGYLRSQDGILTPIYDGDHDLFGCG